jgi:hypothetical protein
MQLDEVSAMIDAIVSQDPESFADGESVVAIHRGLMRLEAFATKATASFENARAYEPDGARNTAAWLRTRLLCSKGYSHRVVRRGNALSGLPVAEQAWSKGEITGEHLDALAGVRREKTEEALSRDEEELVGLARTLRFDSFTRALNYWDQVNDEDGAEERAEQRRNRRDVTLSKSYDGLFFGRMTLDPISGEIVYDELKRIEDELFETDWKEAAGRLGRDPRTHELSRTAAQRRADALVEMATRSYAARMVGQRPAPLFSVYVGYETLHGRMCELAGGSVVTPGALLPWLDEAYVERAVFGLNNRVEVSETARFYTGATRRALELRDRCCTHPYCDEPAQYCEADHIEPYSHGGPTTQENGRMLCKFHNRLRNQRPPPRE